MSHLRDIQKLRHNRQTPTQHTNQQRFSQPSQPDHLHINFDKINDHEATKTFTSRFN